jgi:adenylyltransferase/sulfurtransferase
MYNNEFEISAVQLHARLERGEELCLLDVREPFEYQICQLTNATLIPLGELVWRVDELDKGKEIIIYCHAGVRSARAVAMLYQAGFDKVKNLIGGIDAWAVDVDPRMPRY